MAATCFALHCSLTVGFGVLNLIEPLSFTRNSDTAEKALTRYIKTFVHVALWHLEDIWDVNTNAHKSTQRVRKMHSKVRKAMAAADPTRQHISQYDEGIVQAGFMAFVSMYPSDFGIKCKKQDVADYFYFWRGIGYLIGIKDEYNLCSGGYDTTYRVCKEIEYDFVYRGICNPPKDYELLANAYTDAVNSLLRGFRVFTKESINAFTFGIMKLPLPKTVSLTLMDRLRVLLIKLLVFSMRWVPFVERLLNCLAMSVYKIGVAVEYDSLLIETHTVLDNVSKSN